MSCEAFKMTSIAGLHLERRRNLIAKAPSSGHREWIDMGSKHFYCGNLLGKTQDLEDIGF